MNKISHLRLPTEMIFQSDHLSCDLARKSVRGGLTTMTSQGFQFFLSVIGTVILARLLTPDDYGLVGMVTAVTGFAAMFKNAGLSMATIQSERITPEQISNLFWVNLLISLVLGLVLIAFAPLIAMFYGRTELVGITVALSATFIISGLTIQHQALLYRHMRFGALAVVVILPQVIGLMVSIALAWMGWRYWALVSASLVNTSFATVLTYYFCPWIPRWFQKGNGTMRMLTFGGHLTVTNVANYLTLNMDSVLIGRFIGADGLGLYSRAHQIFLLPVRQIKDPLQNTALPALCAIADQPERYREYYRRFLDLLASLMTPASLYCFIEAEFLVRTLLGPQWSAATQVFRIFALCALILPVGTVPGLVLVSLGKSHRFLWWGIVNVCLSMIAYAIGLSWGIEGVAAAFTVANYVMFFPTLFYCLHETPITVGLFLRTLAPSLFIGLFAGMLAIFVKNSFPSTIFFSPLLVTLVFGVAYVGLSCKRKSLRESLAELIKSGAIKGKG